MLGFVVSNTKGFKMHIFYTPDIKGDDYLLNEQESKHATRVLRLVEGNEVLLIDGRGAKYVAVIAAKAGKKTLVNITSKEMIPHRSSHRLHIAIAPTKNMERLEFFLEKATEIGVDEITPLLCRYSERKVIKDERLERVVIAAAKQSVKAFMPKLNPLTKVADFVKKEHFGGRYIAHCYDMPKEALKDVATIAKGSTVMIGPEGDFSQEEVALASEYGFTAVELGKERLRTETAGIVACHTINLLNS